MTNVAALTAELSTAKKNLVAEFRYNTCLERLLGKCKLGGCMSKKTGIGVSLTGTHYYWLCGCESGHPSFKCSYKKTGDFMSSTRANM